MNEEKHFQQWLLLHGRLTDTAFLSLLWFGLLFLPIGVVILLTGQGDWGSLLTQSIGYVIVIAFVRYLLGPGHPASGQRVPWTLTTSHKRWSLAAGLGMFVGGGVGVRCVAHSN